MNTFNLIFTSVSVSADCFFLGLSLSLKTNENYSVLKGVILSVFALCGFGSLLGEKAGLVFEKYAILLSGLIFSTFAFKNFRLNFNGENALINAPKNFSFCNALLLGASVGVDGAVGCFTLACQGYNGLMVTLIITAIHVLFMLLSFHLSSKIKRASIKLENLPSFLLMVLGTQKILSFFN